MIELLIWLIVLLIVFGLVAYIIQLLPLPPPFGTIAYVVLLIVLLLVLCSFLLGVAPPRLGRL